jgi:hypothetical protein
MAETKLQITPTCYFELSEYESFPATLTLDYTEHSPAHGYSDTDTTVDISKGKAAEIIAFLQRFCVNDRNPQG